jgi:UDP-N-acetylglucosamine/UDP-N-acetylgalactosamine diphosphorylase
LNDKIIKKLQEHDQMHLLKYVDSLSPDEEKEFSNQLENIDFSVLEAHQVDETRGKIEPLNATTIDEINEKKSYFKEIGLDAIRNGKVGAVLLAGGQGSRLGFNNPKGMFNIGINRELYIFECLINNLLEVVNEADAWIPLFIMTSRQNDSITRNFLKEHNYFGYSEENIVFFIQDELPTVDTNGKLMLSDKGTLSCAPNGNGGWYSSMVKSGALQFLKDAQLEWLNVFAVDNVLQKIADPCFIGAVIDSGCESGSKVVAKADANERVGVLCLEDGKPSIVEYYEMTDDMINKHEPDGRLSYAYGVILNYLFKIENLNKGIDATMPLHKAFKKISYLDSDGNKCAPELPNAYKFETLVLDMVKMQDSCLAYEVERNKEFAPVKNKSGVDSIETARELLLENGVVL